MRSEVAVRGTATILHVLKAKGPQFVYQKGRPACSPRAVGPPIRSPHRLLAGTRGAEVGHAGNRAFTMAAKSR
jgi:hypothetical protein